MQKKDSNGDQLKYGSYFCLNLNIQKKSSGVFNKFLNSDQECNSFTTINESVIVSKSNVHHRTDFNLVV